METEHCLVGKDIILRKARVSDYLKMMENVWTDPLLATHMFWSAIDNEKAGKIQMKRTLLIHQYNQHQYFIAVKETDEPIGFAGMVKTTNNVFEETGICIARKFQGKGYGKQVLSLLINEAFKDESVEVFKYHTNPENTASLNLCLHFNFEYEKRIRAYREKDNSYMDIDYYCLTREKHRSNKYD